MSSRPGKSIQPELHRLMLERERFLAHLARRLGVTRTELDAVEELSQRGGVTPGVLGERLSLTSGSVTALLDRLERLDWAIRDRHPDDRRKIVVQLTAAGQAVAKREIRPLAVAIERSASRLAARDRLAVEGFLVRAADAAAVLVAREQALGSG